MTTSNQTQFVFFSPYSIVLDLVGNGGSLVFRWGGKDAALHFDNATDVAKAAEILNEHFMDCMNRYLEEMEP